MIEKKLPLSLLPLVSVIRAIARSLDDVADMIENLDSTINSVSNHIKNI